MLLQAVWSWHLRCYFFQKCPWYLKYMLEIFLFCQALQIQDSKGNMTTLAEADTTYHSSDAETVVFSDSEDDLLDSFEREYVCVLCGKTNMLWH